MVNTGQPSDACIQCRARRIKCDSTRPQCERCIKYGIECPGYPVKEIVFRDDTVFITQRAQKKYEKRQAKQQLRRGGSSDSLSTPPKPNSPTSIMKAKKSGVVIPRPLILSHLDGFYLVDDAVTAFLSQSRNTNVDLWWGLLDPVALSDACNSNEKGSLGSALNAVSLMSLALRPEAKSLDLRTPAATLYGRALGAINMALREPGGRLDDNTLLAVTLTALFEKMQNFNNDDPTLYFTHIRGMMCMINARGPDQFRTVLGRRLFLYAYFNWTTAAMPEIAVMTHLAPSFLPPLTEDILESLLQYDYGIQEPAFRLLPLIHRSLVLRVTAIPLLGANSYDKNPLYQLLVQIAMLDQNLLTWNTTLLTADPLWGQQDHLYQLLTTSWFRTHRIFLADLAILCQQRLAELEGSDRDLEIWRYVEVAQNAIDEICVRIPYSFGEDNPRLRKPHIEPRVVPDAKITYLYHASFEYPLLVCSMVWTLPPLRQKGIEAAREQCATECGLRKPWRIYPKILIYLPPEQRTRYIKFKTERRQQYFAVKAEPVQTP